MDQKIQLERIETLTRVQFEGKTIGTWRDPECSAARWLINHGKATRADILRTFRGENPCMRGRVGWFADRTVREDDTHSPTFVKWKPFPVTRRRAQTASKPLQAPR